MKEAKKTRSGFWARQWAQFEARMLHLDALERRRMPRFGKRWIVYHLALVALALSHLAGGKLVVPALVAIYFLLEGPDVLAELRTGTPEKPTRPNGR